MDVGSHIFQHGKICRLSAHVLRNRQYPACKLARHIPATRSDNIQAIRDTHRTLHNIYILEHSPNGKRIMVEPARAFHHDTSVGSGTSLARLNVSARICHKLHNHGIDNAMLCVPPDGLTKNASAIKASVQGHPIGRIMRYYRLDARTIRRSSSRRNGTYNRVPGFQETEHSRFLVDNNTCNSRNHRIYYMLHTGDGHALGKRIYVIINFCGSGQSCAP